MIMFYAALVHVVEYVNYGCGITFFSFLLYCLLFRTRENLGTYRYLQIIMLVVDATYNSFQMFIQERMLTVMGLFCMIPTSPYNITAETLCLYLAVYNLTFVMIDYSFLYRMWAIKSPHRVEYFSKPLFIILLVLIACTETVVWFSAVYFLYPPTASGRLRLRESTLADFGVDTTTHVMIMGDYYLEDGSLNPTPLYANMVLGSVMSVCFGFMVYATANIVHQLSVSKLISTTSIRLQRQLFITLCLQTVIPLICLYSPCGLMIFMPMLRIDSYWMARATPLLISSFLPLDTLAVILSMSDYRRELARMLRCYRVRTVPVETLNQSTVYINIIGG